MTQPFENILKVKVDCIVLKKPTKDDLATSLAAKADGLFTRDQIRNWLLTEPVEMIQPKIDGWGEGNGNPTKWAGFHEEKNIKDAKTALISDVDLTHRKYSYQPDLTELPEVALHRYIEFTGSAGCAKTYTATHLGLWDACVLVPNNALRVKSKPSILSCRARPTINSSTLTKVKPTMWFLDALIRIISWTSAV